MADKPITVDEEKKELDEATAKKGNQSIRVQAYLEPTTFVEFRVREDFHKYYGIKPVVANTATRAAPRKKVGTAGAGGTAKESNKGNGVSYSFKGKGMPDKKIKIPTTGGDAPLVNSKGTKKKKWMVFRVPSYMSSAAIALWINTAFDTNRKPSYFILESGTRINIDPSFTDPAKLKALKSFGTS